MKNHKPSDLPDLSVKSLPSSDNLRQPCRRIEVLRLVGRDGSSNRGHGRSGPGHSRPDRGPGPFGLPHLAVGVVYANRAAERRQLDRADWDRGARRRFERRVHGTNRPGQRDPEDSVTSSVLLLLMVINYESLVFSRFEVKGLGCL